MARATHTRAMATVIFVALIAAAGITAAVVARRTRDVPDPPRDQYFDQQQGWRSGGGSAGT
jgi:hypothetical protein